MKKIVLFLSLLFFSSLCFANIPLKGYQEEYFDYLVLTGRAKRSYLTYRTLSTNEYYDVDGFWDMEDSKFYYPDLFLSFNSHRPLGQNDGALWQGRGLNARLSGGLTYDAGSFSFTFKPDVVFSQNLAFETVNGTDSYFWGTLDKPQRFGEDPIVGFDFGDSEIRFNKGVFTVGFGTQPIWMGPTYMNAIIHSNNAPTYPRLDMGIRKTEVLIPKLDFSIGEVEAFVGLGVLEKSYDCEEKNTFLALFSAAWKPFFMKNLTIALHASGNTDFSASSLLQLRKTIFNHLNSYEDMKMSVSLDFLFPDNGFEWYTEVGWDDYTGNVIRNIYHTMVYQLGFKKSFDILPSHDIYGELIAEVGNMEMTSDGFAQWSYNFYTHHGAANSYSNKGQILGAGTGYAGNSEYLGINVFYPLGYSTLYVHRSNPDTNYILNIVNHNPDGGSYFYAFKGILDIGVKTVYLGFNDLVLTGGFVGEVIYNDLYLKNPSGENLLTPNFRGEIGVKYSF